MISLSFFFFFFTSSLSTFVLLFQLMTDQSDEGFVDQRFEEPAFMKQWTDEQKAG